MKRTSCSFSVRRISPKRSSGNGRTADTRVDLLAGDRVCDALGWCQVEEVVDEVVVRVVVVREPKGQLESAGPDQLDERFETGLDTAALPARDCRLRTADCAAELLLGEIRTKTCFAEKIGARHDAEA